MKEFFRQRVDVNLLGDVGIECALDELSFKTFRESCILQAHAIHNVSRW